MNMKKSELISNEIYTEIFDSYLQEQVDELNNADIEQLDQVYVSMFEFFRAASETDKHNIVDYIKEIMADTASIILGGIDQVESLGSLTGSFELKYDGELVSGDLQDNFLANFESEKMVSDEESAT